MRLATSVQMANCPANRALTDAIATVGPLFTSVTAYVESVAGVAERSYWVHGCGGWSFVCHYLCSLSPSFKRFLLLRLRLVIVGAMMLAEAVEISW